MPAKVRSFIADEAGAVTTDWVVLTAAVVGMSIALYTFIQGQLTDNLVELLEESGCRMNDDC